MDGEYWVFVAECTKDDSTPPKAVIGACTGELDPGVCVHCNMCMLTYAPDCMVLTMDDKLKEELND